MMHWAIVVSVAVMSVLLLALVMWSMTERRRPFKWHLIGACAVYLMAFVTALVTT